MKKFLSLLLAAMMVVSVVPALAADNTFDTLYSGEVTSLNYLTTSTTNEFALAANVIDTLVEYDKFGQVQPSLAESWEPSSDGLTWTFKLREDAKWVDGNGKEVANVTAHDFVAAAKYILDAQNASGTANILYGVIEGAKAYYEGTATPKEGEAAAPVMDWDTVGIKAINDYTLEYKLITPTPYFLSMTTYVCFMPVYEPFLTEKGAEFGLATGNDTLLYCGAYYLSSFKPQQERILSKNTLNWDADNVLIETVYYKYNKEASTISSTLYLEGEVDSASIENDVAAEWLADPVKADYIRPVRQTSSFYTYFYAFNFNPGKGLPAEYEPENWKKAVASENFRQSIFTGLNRVKAMTITDPDNAEDLIYNTITPPYFVTSNGVDYVNMGALKEITALGADTFNEEAALQYKAAAMEELKDTVTFPVKIYMPYNTSVSGWSEESQLVEQQLEDLLGKDYIDVIIEGYPSSGFLNNTRRAGNYCLIKTNWGPDYSDPQTYTDIFREDEKYNYTYLSSHEDIKDLSTEYYTLVNKAHAITGDIEARYLAYAEAEAFLIKHALVIPFGTGSGGYTASRIDPFTQQYAPFGISNERYKGSVLLDVPMSTDMYYDAMDAWEAEREELVNQE